MPPFLEQGGMNMTIQEAITQVDTSLSNTYTQKEKIGWLSLLDQRVKTLIIDTHEGVNKREEIEKYILNHKKTHEESVVEYMKVYEVTREEAERKMVYDEISYKEAKAHIEATRNDISFRGYDEKTELDRKLLVPAPFDEMYLRWLEAQIFYRYHEEDRYNNAMDVFNTLWAEYRNYYNRQHMPLGQRLKF